MGRFLAIRILGQVVYDLIGVDGLKRCARSQLKGIVDQKVECVCELLDVVDDALESTQDGRMLLRQFLARLLEIQPCSARVQALSAKHGAGQYARQLPMYHS